MPSKIIALFKLVAVVSLWLSALTMTVGCATSTRDKVLRDMAIGAAAGALIGQTKSEYRMTYSTMYAGLGAAMAGAASAYMNVSKDDELRNENQSLKIKLDHFQKQMQPQLIQQGNSLFSSPIPKEVSGLIEPGEWKRYKLDQWVQDLNQANTWYRQVEMFEIVPPVSK